MQAARSRRPLPVAAVGLLPALLLSIPSSAAALSTLESLPFHPDFQPVARVSCRFDSPLPRPLIDAAGCGDVERVRARIADGGDVTATDARAELSGRTALHHAVQRGDATIVEMLLASGAQPNAADRTGNTPLHLLALRSPRKDDDAIARRLLEAGADARLRNARKRTALEEFIAREWRSVQPLRLAPPTLAGLLDEAEAAGPRPVLSVVPAVTAPKESAPAVAPVIAWTPMQVAGLTGSAMTDAPPATAADIEPAPKAAQDPVPVIRETLQAWSSAWSAGDVRRYLSHYSGEFRPAGGKSRAEWRAQREQRVGKVSGIEIRLADVEVAVDGNRAAAKFVQDYRSSSHKAIDRKLLTLVREGQEWKIVEEVTVN